MYDEKGVWQCREFDDCFNCPFPDCKMGTIPKGMSEKRAKIYQHNGFQLLQKGEHSVQILAARRIKKSYGKFR